MKILSAEEVTAKIKTILASHDENYYSKGDIEYFMGMNNIKKIRKLFSMLPNHQRKAIISLAKQKLVFL